MQDLRSPCKNHQKQPTVVPWDALAAALREVTLTSENLTGDIKAFESTPNLWRLNLQNTKVHGDIKALQGLGLESLNLHGTNVFGDLKTLEGDGHWTGHPSVWKYKYLDLGLTNVTGDLSVLRDYASLEEVDLSHTQVQSNSWRLVVRIDFHRFLTVPV